MDLQTGDIGFVHGKTFLDRGIEFFERFLPEAFHHESKAFLPSHCLTIFMEGKDIFCGESVWPRYKIDDFLLDYMGKNEMKMVIKRPIVPFTDAEKEVGKQYMLKLSSYGMYAFWRYPAYIWYALTGSTILFSKPNKDYNTVCFESSALVAAKMRPILFPENYDFMAANALDLYNNSQLETIYKKSF